MGTTQDMFNFFSYGEEKSLNFAQGDAFNTLYDAVIGADAARKLNYKVGDKIVLSHGIAKTSFSQHNDKPFTISGILDATGTPMDKNVFVSLQAIEAIHINWQQGVKLPPSISSSEDVLIPDSVTAVMVGLKSKFATFDLQRLINQFPQEPLTAILPAATLMTLWQILGNVEQILLLISILVLAGALLGMSNMLLVSMRERQHEIAILRVLGASPWVILTLIQLEAILLVITGVLIALLGLWATVHVFRDYIISEYGLFINGQVFSSNMLLAMASIFLASFIVAMIPALSAYRRSLYANLH